MPELKDLFPETFAVRSTFFLLLLEAYNVQRYRLWLNYATKINQGATQV